MLENETIEEEEEQSQTVFMQTVSNTIQECEAVLKRLQKEKKRSGNRYTGKRKSNAARNTNLKIVAVKVLYLLPKLCAEPSKIGPNFSK